MHRFLSLSRTSIDKYQRVSFCSFFDLNRFTISNRTCYLCGKITNSYNNVQIRQQSTITSLNKNPKKERKKRSKSKKLYAELLIVTDSSSKQQKANVKKLTSNDLKLLATTSLNLSELYKLKDNKFIAEHTYSNLGIIETIPNSSDVLIVPVPVENNNQTEIPPVQSEFDNFDGDLTNIPPINTFQPEELEDHNEPVEEIKTRSKTDQKHYEEIVSKTLAAFVEVCCLLKSPQRGLNAVYFHRGRAKKISDKFFTTIKNIDVYNALLKGFASRADWDKCLEILEIVKEDELVLNVQSFVALFECLGRLNFDGNHLRDIRVVVKECRRLGITFDDIMNKGLFENDIRTIVLKAIQAHDPQYAPHYGPPNLQYNNHLVDHLNNPKQLMHQDEEYKKNGGLFTPILLKSLVEEQMNLEINGYLTIKSIESRDEPSREIIAYRKSLEDHYKMWKEAAHVAFTRDLSTLTAQRSSLNYEPYMRCLPVKDYVTIILEEAKKLAQGSETFSPTVHMLYRDMGSKVYTRYKILRKQKSGVMEKICNIHNKYCEYYARDHDVLDVLPNRNVYLNTRQQWQWIDHSMVAAGPTLDLDHQEWVPTILQFIGKFLYHIVMHDLKIDVNSLRTTSKNKNYLPAFYTIFRTQGRIVKEEVKPHPVLSRLYRNSVPETLTFPAEEVPMLCPPVPWISIKTGSYLLSSTDVVRLPYKAYSQKQRLKEADPVQLYPSFDALNQLAAVPWKVNQNMLEIILKVFNEGGSSKLDVPEPPSSLPVPPSPVHDMDKTEKYQLFRQKLQYRRKKAEMYSLWCDCLHRLSLAHHFRNEIFWLPHNMDFRGRVYPIPPHLNHLGSDLARSILVFAEARPLGPNGLDWLKLHLINLTGLKKRDSVAVRLQYAEEMLDTILDSADNPLDGQKWWMESDEPWQTLACCVEVAKAIRSGEPEKYCTHFPIHQDGSCNGLQHYAALGRDSAGAYSVNLAPSEVPQDVYSAVAVLVEEQRRIDAENGIEIAKILEGFVKRKVIKQTVMTTVYGVTRFGARLQIAKQLKDIDDFPKDFVWSASSYLTGRTFDSLRTMFTSTKEIQDWFTDCARLISSVGGQHVEWVTPLGLPVVQPYFKYKKLSSSQIYESYALDKYEKPNVMKQKNAFPPNFIHSLDSSHMMLTSLHCERAGITFVSVHDCYWTHPSTVHIMNKICRDQFVALHSEPILENLSLHLTEKYSYSNNDLAGDGSVVDLTKKKLNRILRQLPKTGDFDINKVLDSVYFFS